MEENGNSSLGEALESGQDINLDDYDAGSFELGFEDTPDDTSGQDTGATATEEVAEPDGAPLEKAEATATETVAGENTDEVAETEEPPADADEAPAPDSGIEVVYNGETLHLSAEDAVPYIQKGMNYEARMAELGEARRYADAVQQLAATSGMAPADLLGYMEEGLVRQQADALVQAGMPADMALDHAREVAALRGKANMLDAQQQRQAASEQAQAQAKADFAALLRKYPDFGREVEKGGFPDDLATMIAGGMPPVQAYESWQTKKENEALKQQLAAKAATDAAKEADQKNRKSAPGSAKGLGDASETSAFSQGFGPPSYF